MTITKDIQRKAGINARKGIPKDEAEQLSKKICDRLAESDAYKKAKVIMSYYPFGSEADVRFFNERAVNDGKTVALPICRGEGIMVAAVPQGADALVTAEYGITAPVEEKSLLLEPSEIDLVIVPCAAFDGSSRNRIGMGAGYYDRYLPKCVNAVCIAAAYEAQQIKGVCAEEWDVALDGIITEKCQY